MSVVVDDLNSIIVSNLLASRQTLADEMYGADSDGDEEDGMYCVVCEKGFRSAKQ